MIVVDASITVGWLLLEEEAAHTRHIYDLVLQEGAIGPTIYPLEVANALRSALRRKSIDRALRDAALEAFGRMLGRPDGSQPSLIAVMQSRTATI